jgi:hypothetical protein
MVKSNGWGTTWPGKPFERLAVHVLAVHLEGACVGAGKLDPKPFGVYV